MAVLARSLFVPTIMTHSMVGMAAATAVGNRRMPGRFWLLATILPSLPDLDTLGFGYGHSHHYIFGHRGFTHSLLVAGLIGMAAAALFMRRHSSRWWLYGLFFAVLTASHGLLDTITSGGGGVALLWPFNDRRFFAGWRPLVVSPIGVRHFLASPRAWPVLASEFVYVWLPMTGVAVLSVLGRRLLRRPAEPSAAIRLAASAKNSGLGIS